MTAILPQGLWLSWRTPTLEEPPGPRCGETGSGPMMRILILGDSSAAGVGAHHQVAALSGQFVARLATKFRIQWHLQAQTGATTASAIEALEFIPRQTYDVILTGLGVNDVKNGVRLDRYCRNTARLYRDLRRRFDPRLIIASGMPPVRDFPILSGPIRWAMQRRATIFDAAHQKIAAANPVCRHLKGPQRLRADHMAHDGFHPGPAVYAEWAKRAETCLIESGLFNAPAEPEG